MLQSFFKFIQEFGSNLKNWMKFIIILLLLLTVISFSIPDRIKEEYFSKIFEESKSELSIPAEKANTTSELLTRLNAQTGAEGSYIFAYVPLYAIKTMTLLQMQQSTNYVEVNTFSHIPITLNGDLYLSMKEGKMYSADIKPHMMYASIYERGGRYVYAYPIEGHDGILYGNITLIFSDKPVSEFAVQEYMKVTVDAIKNLLKPL